MEKKTIGQFIAALRRANGMTQRELAERLNVSDKAVSRWERDESAPDLMLIPVIAEIFGVTSDEILRGERAQQGETATEHQVRQSEKQMKNIVDRAGLRFSVQAWIAVAVAVVGFIAAMICNFGFLRAYIGFYVACVFYVGSAVTAIVSAVFALAALKYEDVDSTYINKARQCVIKTCTQVLYIVIVLLAASAPLLLAGDAYFGLTGGAWLLWGLAFAMVAVGICAIINIVLPATRVGDMYSISDKEKQKHRAVAVYIGKKLAVLAVMVCVTLLAQYTVNIKEYQIKNLFVKDIVYTDYAEFKVYIETPVHDGIEGPAVHAFWNETEVEVESNVDVLVPIDPDTEYDYFNGECIYLWGTVNVEYGSRIRWVDENESILLEFKVLNEDVARLMFDYDTEEKTGRITVYTEKGLLNGEVFFNLLNILFVLAYCAEVIVTAVLIIKRIRTVKIG